MIFKYYN